MTQTHPSFTKYTQFDDSVQLTYGTTTGESGSYTCIASNSHVPNYNLIDLDYPMYGTTVVKCGGKKFDLEVVRKALALAYEMNNKLAR